MRKGLTNIHPGPINSAYLLKTIPTLENDVYYRKRFLRENDSRHENDSCGAVPVSPVLEHIHEPLPCLQAIKRILKPSGMLIVAVPDCACVPWALFGELGNDCHKHIA